METYNFPYLKKMSSFDGRFMKIIHLIDLSHYSASFDAVFFGICQMSKCRVCTGFNAIIWHGLFVNNNCWNLKLVYIHVSQCASLSFPNSSDAFRNSFGTLNTF